MSTNTEKISILQEIFDNCYCSGDEYLFHCPFCEHHKKKLSINIEKNVAKCWICGHSSKDVYALIKRFGSYEQKQKWLEISGQVEINNFDDIFLEKAHEEKTEQIIKLPIEFISLCNKKNRETAKEAIEYLESRNIFLEDIYIWKIGCCLSGIYKKRVIFPSFNNDGKTNYFVARSYIERDRKYLNPPTSNDIIFNELLLDFKKPLTITESVFSAIKTENSVPLLGSKLKENSQLFQRIIENNAIVYIGLDYDAEKKAEKLISDLMRYNVKVYKIEIPENKDLGMIEKEEFNEFKKSARLIRNDNEFLLNKIRGIF